MKATISLLAILYSAFALPPQPPSRNLPDPHPVKTTSDNGENVIQTVNCDDKRMIQLLLLDALSQLSLSSKSDLLDKLRNIVLVAGTDTDLSWSEFHHKYSAAVFDVLEAYASTVTDKEEKDMLLTILASTRELVEKQTYDTVPDKADIISFIRQLFETANESFFSSNLTSEEQQQVEEYLLKQQEFLATLNEALDNFGFW